MKIETKELVKFMKKARMEGDEKIEECRFNYDSQGLKILATSMTKSTQINAFLKPVAFKEYESIGVLGMNDLTTIQKVFDRFNDVITLNNQGNCLTVSGDKKKVEVELVSEKFLPEEKEPQGLKWDNEFVIDAKVLNDIIQDVLLNKDAEMIITTGDGCVKFSNTGKYKFETVIEAPTCKLGTVVKFGKPFIDAVNFLDGQIKISVSSDYPCKVFEETETSIISIICAPRVSDD